MKSMKLIAGISLAAAWVAFAPASRADGTNAATTSKSTPYPLTTCAVEGGKLGEMGTPYAFVYQGQEIKLCCQGCKADFDKNPAKYLKKMKDAAAAAAAKK